MNFYVVIKHFYYLPISNHKSLLDNTIRNNYDRFQIFCFGVHSSLFVNFPTPSTILHDQIAIVFFDFFPNYKDVYTILVMFLEST